MWKGTKGEKGRGTERAVWEEYAGSSWCPWMKDFMLKSGIFYNEYKLIK